MGAAQDTVGAAHCTILPFFSFSCLKLFVLRVWRSNWNFGREVWYFIYFARQELLSYVLPILKDKPHILMLLFLFFIRRSVVYFRLYHLCFVVMFWKMALHFANLGSLLWCKLYYYFSFFVKVDRMSEMNMCGMARVERNFIIRRPGYSHIGFIFSLLCIYFCYVRILTRSE